MDFNATQAAIRAGYAAAWAPAAASRLRAHPAVAAAIEAVRAALRTRCDASADRWLLEVLAISYADPDAKTEDGKPATRLTFSEKVRALELQGRALGFLKEQLEVRGGRAAPSKSCIRRSRDMSEAEFELVWPLDRWHYLSVPEEEVMTPEPASADPVATAHALAARAVHRRLTRNS